METNNGLSPPKCYRKDKNEFHNRANLMEEKEEKRLDLTWNKIHQLNTSFACNVDHNVAPSITKIGKIILEISGKIWLLLLLFPVAVYYYYYRLQ